MSYSLKFLIAAGLGLAAAALNWFAMSTGSDALQFVRVTEDLEVGDAFTSGNLAPLEIPAAFASLRDTAIPFDDRGVLLQRRATRKFMAGDIVFWRDMQLQGPEFELRAGEDVLLVSLADTQVAPGLLRVGSWVSLRFELEPAAYDAEREPPTEESQATWVGPFRVASVGSAVTPGTAGGSSSLIGVVVQRTGQQPREIQVLESFVDRQQRGRARLHAVKLHPNKND